MDAADLSGCRVTVMGLGLHGGGIETARFLCRHGASVTVTDTRPESDLLSSIEKLAGLPIRYVLGSHEESDFSGADMVVKNPAVPRSAALLEKAKRIETDISLFLKIFPNPVIAITGSKGKSTTASAIHHVLRDHPPGSRLGGNITVSPLTFADQLPPGVTVVLELSSFQLGDLSLVEATDETALLKPDVAVITNILPDHQNYYRSMNDYIDDKKMIFRGQRAGQHTVCNFDQSEGRRFAEETPAQPVFFSSAELPAGRTGGFMLDGSGWYQDEAGRRRILGPSDHAPTTRSNLLTAGVVLSLRALPAESVDEGLRGFPGVEHRMECFAERGGVQFVNDSAATIPEAALAAVQGIVARRGVADRLLLITGGTDKELAFDLFPQIARAASETFLLAGSATEKIVPILKREGIVFHGPYDTLAGCLDAVFDRAAAGATVLLSPGCASFGMFQNEFDRGRQFKRLVSERIGSADL
jgi:UDP-N-acetylmuramoylalanine--D-glutamate ligase